MFDPVAFGLGKKLSGLWPLSGAVLGIVVWTASGTLWLGVLAAVFGVVVAWLSGDPRWVITGGVVAACVMAALILMWGWLFGGYRVWGWVIGSGVALLWLAMSVYVRRINSTTPDRSSAAWLSLLGLTWLIHGLTRDWSPIAVMQRLGYMGEDNGSFLNNVAVSGAGWGAALIPTSGGDASSNGGSVLGVVVAAGSWLRGIADGTASTPLGVAETLLRLYDSLGYLILGLSVVMVLSVPRALSRSLLAATLTLTSAGVSLVFLAGLSRAGHFSGYLVALVGLTVLSTLISTRLVSFMTLIPLIMLGQAWQPAILLALVGASLVTCHAAWSWRTSRNRPELRRLMYSIGAVVVTMTQAAQALDGTQQIRNLAALPGGEARVVGWFALVVVVLALLAAERVSGLMLSVVAAFSMTAFLLMLSGWFIEPYEPSYGPNKVLYLVVLILSPLAIAAVANMVVPRGEFIASAVLLCGVLAILNASVTPLNELAGRLAPKSPIEWAPGVVRALSEYPDRIAMCMESREEGTEIVAYQCSRLLGGMQGIHPPQGNFKSRLPTAKETSPLFIFSAANVCGVPSEELADIAEAEYRRLVLVLGDSRSLTTTDGCQSPGWAGPNMPVDDRWILGWATEIRWDLIEMVSYTGESMTRSFDYLSRSESNAYSAEQIAQLNSRYFSRQ